MKLLTLVAVATALTFSSGCFIGFTGTPGSGIPVTQNRTVEDFHAISVSGTADAKVTVGDDASVVVTIDDNLIDMVHTEVVNGELKIWTEGSYRTRIGLDIRVTVPSLDEVTVSGVGDLVVTNIDSPEMEVNVSGVGEAMLTGEVDDLVVKVSGTGDAKLKELIAKTVNVQTSGVGEAIVCATESVDADASGTSDIKVFGSPSDIKQNSSGVGEVVIEGSSN